MKDQKNLEVERFDNLPFIKAFLQVLRGPQNSVPIHYPREQAKPDPKGENFRWFVSNERYGKRALPAATATEGLPYKS